MTHRGTRLAYVLVLLYAAVTAFLVVRGLEESGVLGADHLLQVSGEGGAGGAAAVAALTEVAHEQRVDVGRLVDDVLAPGERRHLYLAVGRTDGPLASWPQDGYPAFAPQGRTEVHPLDELGHLDPRGGYVVFGDAQGLAAVEDAVRGLGYDVRTRAYYDPTAIAQWVWGQPLGTGLLVVALLAVVVAAAGVLAGVKGYAVQRLHGAAEGTVVLRDLRDVARVVALTVGVLAVAAGVGLRLWNGLHQWPTYAAVAGVLAGGLLALVLVAHVAAVALTGRLPVLEALKGRLPSYGTTAAVYLVRVPALVLAVTASVTATVAAGDVAERGATLATWRTAGDAAYLTFSPALSAAETDRLAVTTGTWLATEEAQGRMLLAVQDRLELMAPGAEGDVLVVNSAYLDAQDVRTADGDRLAPPPAGTVRVLVPQERQAEQDALVRAVTAWAQAGPAGDDDVTVDGVLGPAGARVFTYGTERGTQDSPVLTAPVVVVVDAASGVVRPDDYMAWASQGAVLVRDPQAAVASARAAGLADFVTSFRPARQQAADVYAQVVRDLRLHVANCAAALLVLVATAIGLGQVYTRGHAQRIFVAYVHGRAFVRTHPGLLAVEAALTVLVVAASAGATASLLGAGPGSGSGAERDLALGGLQPVLASSWALVSAGAVVAVLVVLTRRLVRTRSAEA